MKVVLDVMRYLSEHNITMAAAAKAAGVANQNIRKSLINNPKTSTILAIANNLGIDPREFYYQADDDYNEFPMPPMKNEGIGNKDEGIGNNDETQPQTVNTTAFCPHCGAKVRVGVVLMPE